MSPNLFRISHWMESKAVCLAWFQSTFHCLQPCRKHSALEKNENGMEGGMSKVSKQSKARGEYSWLHRKYVGLDAPEEPVSYRQTINICTHLLSLTWMCQRRWWDDFSCSIKCDSPHPSNFLFSLSFLARCFSPAKSQHGRRKPSVRGICAYIRTNVSCGNRMKSISSNRASPHCKFSLREWMDLSSSQRTQVIILSSGVGHPQLSLFSIQHKRIKKKSWDLVSTRQIANDFKLFLPHGLRCGCRYPQSILPGWDDIHITRIALQLSLSLSFALCYMIFIKRCCFGKWELRSERRYIARIGKETSKTAFQAFLGDCVFASVIHANDPLHWPCIVSWNSENRENITIRWIFQLTRKLHFYENINICLLYGEESNEIKINVQRNHKNKACHNMHTDSYVHTSLHSWIRNTHKTTKNYCVYIYIPHNFVTEYFCAQNFDYLGMETYLLEYAAIYCDEDEEESMES